MGSYSVVRPSTPRPYVEYEAVAGQTGQSLVLRPYPSGGRWFVECNAATERSVSSVQLPLDLLERMVDACRDLVYEDEDEDE